MPTRRTAILISLGAAAAPVYSKDFWVEKAPDQWSEKDIDKLLNRSPWSKEVNAELNMGMGGGGRGSGSGLPGMSADSAAGMGGGEMPGPGGGGGGRGGRRESRW